MKPFFVHDGTYLLRMGQALERDMPGQAGPGQVVEEGVPGGFVGGIPPGAGFRWNIGLEKWDDCREQEKKDEDAAREVMAKRHAAYPPIQDLADALVHQAMGNTGKMDAYLAACVAVKERFPKVK